MYLVATNQHTSSRKATNLHGNIINKALSNIFNVVPTVAYMMDLYENSGEQAHFAAVNQ